MTQLEQIIHPAESTAERCIIWLHGLGADGNDFLPIAPMLKLKPTTEIVFPHAPMRPITINGGMSMRGWYDITEMTLRHEDRIGIEDSATAIHQIYSQKIAQGIPAKRILFAGFSQGGAMALYCGLHNPCAGILALSCYLPATEETPAATLDAPPIAMKHGTNDPIVAYELGEQSAKVLEQHGYSVAWQAYPMAHEVTLVEIEDIGAWLRKLGF